MLDKKTAATMSPLELARAFAKEAGARNPQNPRRAVAGLYAELRISDRPDKDGVARAISQ